MNELNNNTEVNNTNTLPNTFHGNYDINNKYNNGFIPNNNINNNNKEPMTIKVIVILLLLMMCAVIGWLVYKEVKTGKNKESGSNSEKVDVDIKKTETTSVKSEGTYIVDVSDVVDNVMPSIVAITSKTLVSSGNYGPWGNMGKQYSTGAGSGIIIGKNDTELLILTNKHVIEDAEQLSVKFINDKSVDATVKGASTSRDIAVITIPLKSIDENTLKSIKIATMGSSKDLKVGQGVIAIGNALGYGQSVTTGVISALNREVTVDSITTSMIQIDAAINGGNSGGALLNSKGEVIGINSAKYSSTISSSRASIEGMGFAIPISDVSELIDKLMKGENLSDEQRGYLGVTGTMVDSTDDMPSGFYIRTITKNSGADKAGLAIGNIITKIDGKDVKQFNDITAVLENKKAGDKVSVTIKYVDGREYKEKTVDVKLSSYKEVK